MSGSLQQKLVNKLLENQKISKEKLDRVLELHSRKGGSLAKLLAAEQVISQEELMLLLSQEMNIPPINLSRIKVDESLLQLIPEQTAKHYCLLPVSKIGTHLTIAMADPLNILVVDQLQMLTSFQVDMVIATEKDIREAIAKYYVAPETGDITTVLDELSDKASEGIEFVKEEKLDITSLAAESEAAPIIKMVDFMILESVKRRASDIHIEPTETDMRVRYRIDGDLHEAFRIPKKSQHAVLARVKIMSRLDITENRIPQDGRFKIKVDNKEIDFRVSVLPISHGGKVVLRLLDKSTLGVGIDNLGFLPESMHVFKEALERPFGMILITGPTGSGKSTTLYSIINQLNTIERNIITIEDPVEYQIEGITQVQARADIGLSFANGLRSLLRQSPDIVLIGEIRDFETSDIAIKASLTGQLVLSTLHTNNAIGAITRLIDMGVEPFLVAASLIMVGAQRLCRKICPHCRRAVPLDQDLLARSGIVLSQIPDGKMVYEPVGCERCNMSGYFGRTAILEAFLLDTQTREMIVAGATLDEISEHARAAGMKTLRDNIVNLFLNGSTSLDEVLRVTAKD